MTPTRCCACGIYLIHIIKCSQNASSCKQKGRIVVSFVEFNELTVYKGSCASASSGNGSSVKRSGDHSSAHTRGLWPSMHFYFMNSQFATFPFSLARLSRSTCHKLWKINFIIFGTVSWIDLNIRTKNSITLEGLFFSSFHDKITATLLILSSYFSVCTFMTKNNLNIYCELKHWYVILIIVSREIKTI